MDTVSHQGVINGMDPVKFFGAGDIAPSEVLPDAIEIYHKAEHPKDSGAHVLTGPVYIDGAEPGDMLEVRILDLKFRVPYGVNNSNKGSGVLPAEPAAILAAAREIGYPVLVKPAGGGGGIGMLPANSEAELLEIVERSRSMASRGFGNAEVYLERLFERPRHVEFQVLGDQHGDARHLSGRR
jgi:acetyl-CoA carboxylase biotin carboxylase subunit